MISRWFPSLAALNIACIVTSSGAILSLLSVKFAFSNSITIALILYLLAIIADRVDGFVARKFKVTSKFGAELDSLADAVSFGVAPILIFATQIEVSWYFLGAAAWYFCTAIWRLAYFNVSGLEEDSAFVGIPTTLAGALFFIFQVILLFIPMDWKSLLAILFLIIVGALMISGVRFYKNGFISKNMTLVVLCALIFLLFR